MDKREDKANYDNAWKDLEQADPAAAKRVLEGAARLARQHGAAPRQGDHVKDVHALMEEAAMIEPRFHAAIESVVVEAGGKFLQGPLKKVERVFEKVEMDYDGDHLRVVDIVRDSAVFLTMGGYAQAVKRLLEGDCGVEVVRAKDRLAHGGNSYGCVRGTLSNRGRTNPQPLPAPAPPLPRYRDMLLNVKLPGSEHVGELQLHFQVL